MESIITIATVLTMYFNAANDANAPYLYNSDLEDGVIHKIEVYEQKADNQMCAKMEYRYNYDEQGHNISTETYEDGVMVRQILREYDQRGFVVKETDGMTGEEVTLTHNELGQVVTMTMFMDGEQVYTETRQYDALGHRIIESDAYTYEYHYNEEGLLTSVRHSYGEEVFGDVFVEYRVVYVTAAEAVELLDATNDALDWCLNY